MINPKYSKGLKIVSGKGDYIQKRNADGEYDPVCLCTFNIDLSPGCISNTHCKTKKRSATRHNCVYCYARRTNYHEARPYHHDKSTLKEIEKDIIENKIRYIRFGKKVECGNKENRSLLLKILEIGGKHDVQFIMPTKYLEFNKTVANLFKETNSVLGFSIGADRFEDGACSYGCKNKFRLKEAHKYLDNGNNTILKIVTDMTVHPKIAEERGWSVWQALNEFPLENIEMLPVRIKAKDFAYKATGERWNSLQSPRKGEHLFNFMEINRDKPRYVMERDVTILIANYFDEYYYENGIVKNKQICGHIGTIEEGTVFCDMCHVTDKKGRKLKAESFPMSDLPPNPSSQRNWGNGARRKWYDPNNWKKIYSERNDKKYQLKLDLK
jgi:hypothetical protein